jgi:hypothetical protein
MRRPLGLHLIAVRLIACLAIVLAPVPTFAAEVVTASVLPGVKVASSNALSTGVSNTFSVTIPSGFATVDFANGTSAKQVSVKWADTRTLAVSTPVTLDLTSLTGTTTNTGAATFAKVKILSITNNETQGSGKTLTVGAAASNPFLGPLGGTAPTFAVEAGTTVTLYSVSTAAWTTSSASNLKLDPGANSISTTTVIVGN